MKKIKTLLLVLSLAVFAIVSGCTIIQHPGKGKGPHKAKIKSNKNNSKFMIK